MAELKHEVKPEGIAEPAAQFVPSIHLEVSKDQLELLEVDNDVVITLKGKVKGLHANEMGEDSNRYEIRLEMQEVVIDPKENEFSKLLDEDE